MLSNPKTASPDGLAGTIRQKQNMEMLIVAALIYWAMSAVFELVQARIEKRFGKGVSRR